MQYVKINLKKIEKEQIDLIVDYLNQGRVIVHSTDTVYGLGCDATNKKAVEKIIKIKKRKDKLGLVVLIKSYCMLHDYCFTNKLQENYIRSIWPPTTQAAHDVKNKFRKKPTTFVLKGRKGLAKEVYGPNNSLAVRLPKNDFLIRILKGVNKPIISTSLNISGKPVLKDVKNLNKNFKNIKPDLIIDAGVIKNIKASRIIDISDMDEVKKIR